jgi:hypothetical protein
MNSIIGQLRQKVKETTTRLMKGIKGEGGGKR